MTTTQSEGRQTASAAVHQSLARGALGAALLHAVRGDEPRAAQALHQHIARALPLVTGDEACLQYGAPALAFVLHIAAQQSPSAERRYRVVRARLDDLVVQVTQKRLSRANGRRRAGLPTAFREYDLLHGLSGLGRLHLLRRPDADITADILSYLVELTSPIAGTGVRPGWWVWHHHSNVNAPGGHANAGIAHGIAGPLAVLSIAVAQGVRVPGDIGAIETVLDWLDRHQVEDREEQWWRRWPGDTGGQSGRTYWCYGTPGIARAEQLAALALGDSGRAEQAERMHLACLTDSDSQRRSSDLSLCHGTAGMLQATRRIAADSSSSESFDPAIGGLQAALYDAGVPRRNGLLEGVPGILLARDYPPASEAAPWDACLGLA